MSASLKSPRIMMGQFLEFHIPGIPQESRPSGRMQNTTGQLVHPSLDCLKIAFNRNICRKIPLKYVIGFWWENPGNPTLFPVKKNSLLTDPVIHKPFSSTIDGFKPCSVSASGWHLVDLLGSAKRPAFCVVENSLRSRWLKIMRMDRAVSEWFKSLSISFPS